MEKLKQLFNEPFFTHVDGNQLAKVLLLALTCIVVIYFAHLYDKKGGNNG